MSPGPMFKPHTLKPAAALLLVLTAIGGSGAVLAALYLAATADPDNRVTTSALAAFFGAFFAFLFVRLGNAFTRIYERQAKHHSALVTAEFHLNGILSDLDDNLYLINMMVDNLGKPATSNTVPASVDQLEPVEIRQDLLLDLLNIDLVNDLFVLFVHLRKLNSSFMALNRVHEKIVSTYLGRSPDFEGYRATLPTFVAELRMLGNFVEASKAEVVENMACVRVLLRDYPLLAWLVRLLTRHHYSRNFGQLVAAEAEVVAREIREGEEQSMSRIERIRKGKPTSS